MFPFFLIPTNTGERLCDNNEGTLFRCVPSWGALFYILRGEYMNNNDIPRKIIDITGVELTPGELPFVLATESKDLNAVATNATTFCFVSPKLIRKAK